jgi:lipopolysaccharide/colanic/teichoic acid biosynthesis glycosyltransferase
MVKHHKTGITGFVQVNGYRGILHYEENWNLISTYIENWNLLMDINILFQNCFGKD